METRAAERRVYRSRDAYIGGVCAGIAARFELDAIVVRILAVLVAGATLGLGAIAYAVLWASLPLEPEPGAPYEVKPASAESDALGCIDCATGFTKGAMRETDVSGLSLLVRLAVAVCLMVLFLLVAINVSPMLPGTEWWQFWPIGLLILGLCLIVIPIPTRFKVVWHALGIVVTSLAATVFPMSLGIMSWGTFSVAFSLAWPLLLLSIALCALGLYRRIDALVVGAAFCVAAFCLVALTTCALPGDMETLFLHMPGGRHVKIALIG